MDFLLHILLMLCGAHHVESNLNNGQLRDGYNPRQYTWMDADLFCEFASVSEVPEPNHKVLSLENLPHQ